MLQDEVPMINFLINTAYAGQTNTIDGLLLNPDWSHTMFTKAYFTE